MMGNHFSKNPRPQLDSSNSTSNGGSSSSSGSNPSNNNNINYKKELNSYELECQQDPTLQIFDTALHNRTITAISVLATSDISSLSFDTFSQITGCLLDNNQEVVKIILDYKEDIWNNPEFFDLVKDYFENSLQTLDFCTSLEKCLKKARDSQFIIQLALQLFEEEEGEEGGGGKKYSKTLEELQHFKAVGDPFTEEFYQLFEMVYKNQVAMLERLKQRKKKLDKKLKSVKAWRRVSSIIFVSAFAAVLICSVVAATMAAPPVAAALAAAASIPLGSMGKWIDNLWRDYTNVLEGEKGVISIMEFGTKFAINDLKSIRVLVDRLENEIRALVMNVDFAMRDEERVRFGIEEIKKKLGVFMKSIEDLGKEVDKSTRDIQRARTVVLQRIVKYPK